VTAESLIKDIGKHKANAVGKCRELRNKFLFCTQIDNNTGIESLITAYLNLPHCVIREQEVSMTVCVLTSRCINTKMAKDLAAMISRARQCTTNLKIMSSDKRNLNSIYQRLSEVDKGLCNKKEPGFFNFTNLQYSGQINIVLNPNFNDLRLCYEEAKVYVHLDTSDSCGLAVGRALASGLEVLSCAEHNLKDGILAPMNAPIVSTGRSRELRQTLKGLQKELEAKYSLDDAGGTPAYLINTINNIETESLTKSLLNVIEMSEGSRLIMRINVSLCALGRLGGHNRFGTLMVDAIHRSNQEVLNM